MCEWARRSEGAGDEVICERTVRRHLKALGESELVRVRRVSRGMLIDVRVWPSRTTPVEFRSPDEVIDPHAIIEGADQPELPIETAPSRPDMDVRSKDEDVRSEIERPDMDVRSPILDITRPLIPTPTTTTTEYEFLTRLDELHRSGRCCSDAPTVPNSERLTELVDRDPAFNVLVLGLVKAPRHFVLQQRGALFVLNSVGQVWILNQAISVTDRAIDEGQHIRDPYRYVKRTAENIFDNAMRGHPLQVRETARPKRFKVPENNPHHGRYTLPTPTPPEPSGERVEAPDVDAIKREMIAYLKNTMPEHVVSSMVIPLSITALDESTLQIRALNAFTVDILIARYRDQLQAAADAAMNGPTDIRLTT